MNGQITLLKDESLGGIMREYRKVKRKANVGERVLIVNAGCSFGHYDDGDVITITEVIAGDPYFPVKKNEDNPDGTFYLNDDEYVVLEPSDILRIDDPDGVNRGYRIVDRKAAVGDYVLITKGSEWMHKGALIPFNKRAYYASARVINYVDGDYGTAGAEFVVLEPLTQEPAPLSALPLADQYAENITVLTRKIAELEADLRMAREDIVLIEEGVSSDIKALEKRATTLEGRILALETDSSPACVKVAEGPVDNALPSFAKTPQMIRDEIVERAKADVKTLSESAISEMEATPTTKRFGHLNIEFVVNRSRKTVVALLRDHYTSNKTVRARGIAKCAPGDVFNAHIGRAISLRRALGLEVPAEYLNAPGPEEVRVGDVITFSSVRRYGTEYVVTSLNKHASNLRIVATSTVSMIGESALGGDLNDGMSIILEDSREEDSGVTAASSPRKEAA